MTPKTDPLRQPCELALYTEATGAGVGRYSYELAFSLSEAGIGLEFIAPTLPWESDGRRPWLLRTLLPAPNAINRPAKITQLVWRALVGAKKAYAAGRTKPVVFSHLVGHVPVSLFGFLGAKISGAKCALLLHDFYPHTFKYVPQLRFIERFLYRWAYRRFDLIVPLSEAQIPRLRQIGVPLQRIERIAHGVFPVDGVRRTECDRVLRFLIFGTMRPNKNVLASISAFQNMRREHESLELRLAGAPSREDYDYWISCQDQIETANFGIKVHSGFIAEENLPDILSDIDAFICAYDNFDSQSGVVMMALSNGIPVIATDVVGLEAEYHKAVTNIESPPTASAIEDALHTFARLNQVEVREKAKEVQKHVLNARSWDSIAQTLVSTLHDRDFFR